MSMQAPGCFDLPVCGAGWFLFYTLRESSLLGSWFLTWVSLASLPVSAVICLLSIGRLLGSVFLAFYFPLQKLHFFYLVL